MAGATCTPSPEIGLMLASDAARAVVPILNPDTVKRAAMADHAWDIDTDLLLQNGGRKRTTFDEIARLTGDGSQGVFQ